MQWGLWLLLGLLSYGNAHMLKFGHRGASGHVLENTIQSFEKAIELGVDGIEFDVRRCASGELVVFHDDTVDRITNGSGFVDQLTFDELKSIPLKDGQTILTLKEAIEVIDRRAIANIELKDHNIAQDVSVIINEFKTRGWKSSDFLVSSFDHHELIIFKHCDIDIPIVPLIVGIPVFYAQFAQNMRASYVGLSVEFITQAFVDDAHNRGFKVLVFTVNDPEKIRRIKNLNVDGIFSDFPERV